jgi:hypothetical protein
VVDQVCLVPDLRSFLEAISFWDEDHYFPILIDSPAWSLPFLRAFLPARVVRFASPEGTVKTEPTADRKDETPAQATWQLAVRSLNRAWSAPPPLVASIGASRASPRKRSAGEPGLVLTSSECPAFGGAVALAAGHFQGMLRVDPSATALRPNHNSQGSSQLEAVISAQEAFRLARVIEACVGKAVPRYDQLGDDCDFLTLATDFPYRYLVNEADGPARGVYALDDLVGRRLFQRDASRSGGARRWAYAGRLLGDPVSSVARAMASLFLQPRSALLWNTYRGGAPWSDYDMSRAASKLCRDVLGGGAVEHRVGRRSDLTSWHRVFDPVNRFGLVFVNSSGVPQRFAIEGGPGRPADVPRGGPVAVSMIHSHSAADLANPQTIARRWLEQGAYVFYGSVNEPFLAAFRQPGLVADLLAVGAPLVAALRQGETEAFGSPWRLIYLGDPLYRVEGCRNDETPSNFPDASRRLTAHEWRTMASDYANWRITEITKPLFRGEQVRTDHVADPDTGGDTDTARLYWCLDSAIIESAAGSPPGSRAKSARSGTRRGGESIGSGARTPPDWRTSLRSIDRSWLKRKLRPIFDELLIDALSELGADEELQSRLSRIPSQEKSPRIWMTVESCAVARLARFEQDPDRARGFRRALDLWSEVIKLSWPQGSAFPGQFTERMTAVAGADASRRMHAWLTRLRAEAGTLSARPHEFPHVKAVAEEQRRVEATIGQGLRW